MILISLALILVSGALLAAGILRGDDSLVIGSMAASLLAAGALFMGIQKHRQALARRSGTSGADPGSRDGGRIDAAQRTFGAGAIGAPASAPDRFAQRADAPAGPATATVPDTDDPETTVLPASPIDLHKAPATGTASIPGAGLGHPGLGHPGLDGPGLDGPGRGQRDLDDADLTAVVPAAGSEHTPDAGTALAEDQSLDDRSLDDRPLDDPPDEPPAELLMASELARVAELDAEVLVVDGRPRYHLAGCEHLADKSAQGLPAAEAIELGFTACSMCTAATTMLGQVARS